MAVWDPRCCLGFALAVASRGYSLVVEHRLLTVVASLVAEHGLCAHRLQELQLPGPGAQLSSGGTGLAALCHVGSSQDGTRISCIGE